MRGTPENKKVQYASLSWNHFVQLIQIWFGLPLTDSPIGELALLRREGSVDDFCVRFMVGLGQPLCTDVALQKPATLDDAVMYAHAYEQRNQLSPATTTSQSRSAGRLTI
jgi:hypothetical protein